MQLFAELTEEKSFSTPTTLPFYVNNFSDCLYIVFLSMNELLQLIHEKLNIVSD